MRHASRMLDERRATSFTYDLATDVARIAFDRGGDDDVLASMTKATLLVDARGFLVGADIGEGTPARAVVMLGAHEDVARTTEAPVVIARDAKSDGFELHVAGAKGLIRAHEKSPYLP
jgi:hypothetical protein